ncbi:unnamed protein product [Closterium sp. NIES-53]
MPVPIGNPGDLLYTCILKNAWGAEVSPLHDVPLFSSSASFHFVCLCPRGSTYDMAISLTERLSPLKSRLVNRNLSRLSEPSPWHFGLLPQTLANEEFPSEVAGLSNDNQPLDAIELGFGVRQVGDVYEVRPIGAFGLVDPLTRALSWKVLVVAWDDPLFGRATGLDDVESLFPGVTDRLRTWLARYRSRPGRGTHSGAVMSPRVVR